MYSMAIVIPKVSLCTAPPTCMRVDCSFCRRAQLNSLRSWFRASVAVSILAHDCRIQVGIYRYHSPIATHENYEQLIGFNCYRFDFFLTS